MRQQGWNDLAVKWVESFMTRRAASVRYGETTTDMVPLNCGLPQGLPTSPVLLLYTEPIHRLDDEKGRFGYADDCAMLTIADDIEEATTLAQEKVDNTLNWGAENAVSFGPAKTEIMVFSRKIKNKDTTVIKHGDREIKPKEAMRWLGIFLTPKLSYKIHIAEKLGEARKVVNHLRGLNKVMRGAPPHSITKAMKAVVLPKLLFGAEVWYPGPTRPSLKRRHG